MCRSSRGLGRENRIRLLRLERLWIGRVGKVRGDKGNRLKRI